MKKIVYVAKWEYYNHNYGDYVKVEREFTTEKERDAFFDTLCPVIHEHRAKYEREKN